MRSALPLGFTHQFAEASPPLTSQSTENKQIEPFQPICLNNSAGLTVQLICYGATITSIEWQGQPMTLGYATPAEWQQDPFYMGATVGRYANRIANAKFQTSSGNTILLAANQGQHTLHGGPCGFQQQTWQLLSQSRERVVLYLDSADGDQGFPHRLQVWQTIQLAHNDVQISFHAIADGETVVNLTNHCYFNLGDGQQLHDHELQIFADSLVPVDLAGIPTGEPVTVEALGLDFRRPQQLGPTFEKSATLPHGLDHCFVTQPAGTERRVTSTRSTLAGNGLQQVAMLRCGERRLEVHSTQPGLQAYLGSYLHAPFKPYQGICLEAQNWPDAPNWPGFPQAFLQAGELYQQQIIYRFF